MNLNTTPGTNPKINFNANANLDIKLDGWPAVAGIGIIGTTLIAITAMWLKSRV